MSHWENKIKHAKVLWGWQSVVIMPFWSRSVDSLLCSLKMTQLGLAWCSSGWESACQCGGRVRSLVWEDPTCRRATKPACHNYWSACTQRPCSATRKATAMRSQRTAKKSSSCLPHTTRESRRAATKTQCSQKKKKRHSSQRQFSHFI